MNSSRPVENPGKKDEIELSPSVLNDFFHYFSLTLPQDSNSELIKGSPGLTKHAQSAKPMRKGPPPWLGNKTICYVNDEFDEEDTCHIQKGHKIPTPGFWGLSNKPTLPNKQVVQPPTQTSTYLHKRQSEDDIGNTTKRRR